MTSAAAQPAEIVEAAHALAALGLVSAFGHISARAGTSMLITPAGDLAAVSESTLVTVPLDTTSLPPRSPAEAWIHLAIYQRRGDVDSIARAQPTSAFAAAATTSSVRPVHGQAAWLGRSVPVHDSAHLLRSADRAAAAALSFPEGEALLLRGNGAISVGSTPGIAVARMWLLSAACEVHLATQSSGDVVLLTDDEIDSWRAVQDELLPRLWSHLQQRRALCQ